MNKLIIIGGSAGSLEVLLQILPALSPDLTAPVIIVLHRKTTMDNILLDLLSSRTTLPVKEIEGKETALPGHIYIVPSDYHLLVENDCTFTLDYSEKINYSRPSIDVVYESAAHVYGAGLTCILLSGANADGTEGMHYVKKNGGTTIAQDPATAEVPYMPENAIRKSAADLVYTPEQIIQYINDLSSNTY